MSGRDRQNVWIVTGRMSGSDRQNVWIVTGVCKDTGTDAVIHCKECTDHLQ